MSSALSPGASTSDSTPSITPEAIQKRTPDKEEEEEDKRILLHRTPTSLHTYQTAIRRGPAVEITTVPALTIHKTIELAKEDNKKVVGTADKADNLVTVELGIPLAPELKLAEETEQKVAADKKPKGLGPQKLAIAIHRERQEVETGTLLDRVRIRAINQELRNATIRTAKTQNIAKSKYELPRFGASQNPVTKLTEASFLPQTSIELVLDAAIHWDQGKNTLDAKTIFAEFKSAIDAIQNQAERSDLLALYEPFLKKIDELLSHKINESFYEAKEKSGDLRDFDRNDLHDAFRKVFMHEVQEFQNAIQPFNGSNDPEVKHLLRLVKEQIEESGKGALATDVKRALNSLYKKEDVLQLLRFWVSQISLIPETITDLKEVKNEEDKKENDENDKLLVAIGNLEDLDFSDVPEQEEVIDDAGIRTIKEVPEIIRRIRKINESHQEALDEINKLIAKVMQAPNEISDEEWKKHEESLATTGMPLLTLTYKDFSTSGYVEKRMIDQFLEKQVGLTGLVVFIFKGPQKKDLSKKTELQEKDIGTILDLKFRKMLCYVSSKEILVPHTNTETDSTVTKFITEALQTSNKGIPLTRLINHLKLMRKGDPLLEDVPFDKATRFYRKDEVIAALEIPAEYDEELKKSLNDIKNLEQFYISENSLQRLLPADTAWPLYSKNQVKKAINLALASAKDSEVDLKAKLARELLEVNGYPNPFVSHDAVKRIFPSGFPKENYKKNQVIKAIKNEIKSTSEVTSTENLILRKKLKQLERFQGASIPYAALREIDSILQTAFPVGFPKTEYEKDQVISAIKIAIESNTKEGIEKKRHLNVMLQQVQQLQDTIPYAALKEIAPGFIGVLGKKKLPVDAWHLPSDLNAYVFPTIVNSLSAHAPTQNALHIATAQAQIEQTYPAEFSFKLGLENKRELLMSYLLQSLGVLRRFLLPKVDVALGNASFKIDLGNGTFKVVESPAGIAGRWIKGSEFDADLVTNYRRAKRESVRYEYYESLMNEKQKLEKELLTPEQLNQNPNMELLAQNFKILNKLQFIANVLMQAEVEMKNKPKTVVLQELTQAENAFDPRTRESLMCIGIINLFSGSIDTHMDQLIVDSNGDVYDIDDARFGLTYPTYQSEGRTFTFLRSFSLDHPFATQALPPALVDAVLAFNPTAIEDEWRAKGLIREENTRYSQLVEIRGYLKQIKEIEKATNFQELPRDPTIDQTKNFQEVKSLKAKEIIDKINKLGDDLQLTSKCKEDIIQDLKEERTKFETTRDPALFSLVLGRNIEDKEMEECRAEVLKKSDVTIAKVEKVEKLSDIRSIFPTYLNDYLLPDLNDEIDRELSSPNRELSFSKLSEPAAKQFIHNISAFQKYLLEKRQKGEVAKLREGAETVYYYLKPFLDALQLITGQPFENMSIRYKTDDKGNQQSYYASLEDNLDLINKYRNFVPDEQYNKIIEMYNNIKNGNLEGIKLGHWDANHLDVDY